MLDYALNWIFELSMQSSLAEIEQGGVKMADTTS